MASGKRASMREGPLAALFQQQRDRGGLRSEARTRSRPSHDVDADPSTVDADGPTVRRLAGPSPSALPAPRTSR